MELKRPRVGIIGGAGRMGSWLARLLKRRDIPVLISDQADGMNRAAMVRKCDVIVVSVPIDRTPDVIKEIGPLVDSSGLMMDLASIKKGPVEAMLTYCKAEVVGVHPLFGPNETSRNGLKIALCPGRGKRGIGWVRDLFISEGYEVITVNADQHDRIMGVVQGVNHFSNLALAFCIHRCGIPFEDLKELSTPSFKQRLDRISAMMHQPSELFGSILIENEEGFPYIEKYISSVQDLMQVTKCGDKKGFDAYFEKILATFSSFTGGDKRKNIDRREVHILS